MADDRSDKRVAFQCAHCGRNQTRKVRRGFFLRCVQCNGPNPGPAMTNYKPGPAKGPARSGAVAKADTDAQADPPAEHEPVAPRRRRAVIGAAPRRAAAPVAAAPAGQPAPQPADIPGSQPGHTGGQRRSGGFLDRLMYGGD